MSPWHDDPPIVEVGILAIVFFRVLILVLSTETTAWYAYWSLVAAPPSRLTNSFLSILFFGAGLLMFVIVGLAAVPPSKISWKLWVYLSGDCMLSTAFLMAMWSVWSIEPFFRRSWFGAGWQVLYRVLLGLAVAPLLVQMGWQ